jgi:hypothetical protein
MKPSHITVKLGGGLGNQLFIWATALHLKKSRKIEIVLDASECTEWGNQISDFGIQVHIPGPLVPDGRLPGRHSANANCVIRTLRKIRRIYRRLHVGRIVWENPNKSFDSKIFSTPPGKVLRGYFQSYKYFMDSSEEIRELLSRPARPTKEFEEMVSNLPVAWVAIHMRLGLGYKVMEKQFGILGKKYFDDGIQYVEKLLPNLPIYVFSDDIELAKEILPGCFAYIGKKELFNPVERLLVMSYSHAFIGSNSTFSWWAAFLNKNKNAVKIFPEPWFLDSSIRTEDLIPPDWVLINRS